MFRRMGFTSSYVSEYSEEKRRYKKRNDSVYHIRLLLKRGN